MNHPRANWTLANLTELDLRLREEIVLEAGDLKPGVALPRAEVLRTWLGEQRRRHPEAARTAGRLVKTERVLRILAFGFLFLSGAGAAVGLLQYEGDRLINISFYLGTLVFGQLGLLLLLILTKLLLRRRAGTVYEKILFHWVEGKGTGAVRLEPMRSIPAWSARAFASMQLAAVGFNLGVLAATGALGVTRDLAFGWATTLDVGAERMARLTTLLARPWGGYFAPTPDQIAFSRIVLKDGLEQIDPRAAAAWWPFLMMCVLFYGLLPRLMLTLAGGLQLRWRLRRVRLEDPACERLYLRLTRKPLQFQTSEPVGDITALPPVPVGTGIRPQGPVHVIHPFELQLDPAALSNAVEGLLEVPVVSVAETEAVPDSMPVGGLVLIQELWQPPLEESLHRLRGLREEAPPNTDLTLIGIGYPEEGRLFTQPAATDTQVWLHALARLSDPHVQLVVWPG